MGDSTNVVVERVDLGEAAPIDDAVGVIAKRFAAGQYRAKDLPPAFQRLSDLVYVPLAKHLTNVSHLIICPDGQLSRLRLRCCRSATNFCWKKRRSAMSRAREKLFDWTQLDRTKTTAAESEVSCNGQSRFRFGSCKGECSEFSRPTRGRDRIVTFVEPRLPRFEIQAIAQCGSRGAQRCETSLAMTPNYG